MSLFRVGFAALAEGDLVAARTNFEQARDLGMEIGDDAGLPHLVNALGEVSMAERNVSEAKQCFEQSLKLFEAQGDRRSIAGVKKSLAMVACEEGRFNDALHDLRDGLTIRRELNNETGIAVTLDCIGVVHARRGEVEKAVLLLAVAHGLHAARGSRPEPADAAQIEDAKVLADQTLGCERFDLLWQQGTQMPLDEAIVFALDEKGVEVDVMLRNVGSSREATQ